MQRNRTYLALAVLALLLTREAGILHFTAHIKTGATSITGWEDDEAEELFRTPSSLPRSGSLRVGLSRGGERLDELWVDGDGETRIWTAEVRDERIGGLWWLPLWKPVSGSWKCDFLDENGHEIGTVSSEVEFGILGLASASYARECVREELREGLPELLVRQLQVSREPTLSGTQ